MPDVTITLNEKEQALLLANQMNDHESWSDIGIKVQTAVRAGITRPCVLVIRQPDDDNWWVIDGDVKAIDIDLGRGFSGIDDIGSIDKADAEDYVESWTAQLDGLGPDSAVRQEIEELIARAQAAIDGEGDADA